MKSTNTKPEAVRPYGRSLADLWLSEGGVSDPSAPSTHPNKFKLHPAEWRLLQQARIGRHCAIGETKPDAATPENTIRAGFLRFVALGGDDQTMLHERGLRLDGAWIEGDLDLEGTDLPTNLRCHACHFDGSIILRDTNAYTLSFSGSFARGIEADRLETVGSFYLEQGFRSKGIVRMLGANIGRNLVFRGGQFEATDRSLQCDRMRVQGTVFFDDGFIALGTVRFVGAVIEGDLRFDKGTFLNKSIAIDGDRTRLGGALFMSEDFVSEGRVTFQNAKIELNVDCRSGAFKCTDQALNLKNSIIGGDVYFSKLDDAPTFFAGSTSLKRASVGGDLIFNATTFDTIGQINLNNAKIAGQLIWRDLIPKHAVEESETKKTEETTWHQKLWPSNPPKSEAPLPNEEGHKPPVAELNLAGASCQTISMDEASWHMPGVVRIDHFKYSGFSQLNEDWNTERWINWLERQPEKHLTKRFRPHPFQQLASVLESSGFEDEARGIRIERKERQRIFARDYEPASSSLGGKFLRQLGLFWRFLQKWIVGHGYRPGVAVFWLAGIILLGTGVYQKAAWDGVMTPAHPLIFKEAIWHGEIGQTPAGKIPSACRENWVYPQQVLAKPIADKCAASVPSEYSTFNAFVYSLDVAVPVVNFRMESDWAPRVVDWQTGQHDWYGWSVRAWEWIQIGLGWAFSLLFVSAISGVIRRE